MYFNLLWIFGCGIVGIFNVFFWAVFCYILKKITACESEFGEITTQGLVSLLSFFICTVLIIVALFAPFRNWYN